MWDRRSAQGLWSLIVGVLGPLVIPGTAAAQDINLAIPNFYSEPGDSPQRAQNDPIGTEFIDPFTGALILRYRDLVVPGNGGMDIAITRTYRSLAGQPGVLGPNYGPFEKRTIFGIGWDISFGRVWQSNSTGTGNLSPTSSRTQCGVANSHAGYNPILELPDGTREPLITADSTTHAFITPSRSIGKCIMTSDPPAEMGDGGLIVHSSDGTKYWFNKFAVVFNSSSQSLAAKMAFHPTRIEKPNGSFLTISYLNRGVTNDYALIDTVTANDGRQVKFEYWDLMNGSLPNAHVRIKSIRILGTPSRQWNYDYQIAVSQGTGNYYYLTRVTRPDGEFWEYDYRTTAQQPGFHSMETVTTPTGLTTTYSYIQKLFATHNPSEQVTVVSSKTVGGTIQSSSTWSYDYFPAAGSATVDRTVITGPESKCTEYQHTSGNVSTADFWKIGTLLSVRHSSGSSCTGTTPKTETFVWTFQQIATQGMYRPPNFISTTGYRVPRMESRVVRLDGTDYETEIISVDAYGNPTEIVETGNDGSRAMEFEYYEDTTKWIVGPDRVTSQQNGGIPGSITRSFFSSSGNLQTENRYGSTTSYTYLSNGEVDERTDPNTHKTKFLNYWRGVPREIRRKRDTIPANDIVITQVVDDAGNITSVTNGRGKTTGYGYDGSDQVNAITTPNLADSNIGIVRAYNTGSIGLKSVLTRGNYRETRDYNGFGDLTRVEAVDTSLGHTVSQQFAYDAARRLKYSYNPNETATNRRTTRVYDVIDRVEEIWHPGDSPKIFFDYDPDGRVVRTDERGYKFNTKFRAFGDPSEQWQVETIGPYVSLQTEAESQSTTIGRNNLGMVTSVSRDGITRQFAFDSRLFPDFETHPETGVTNVATDNEGKITSRKVGVEPAPETIFQYDPFDRLDYVDYPGSTPDADYEYYGDDLVKSIVRGPTRWDYLYDDNGNLTEEKLTYTGVGTFTTNYLPDDKDALTRISYPTPPGSSRLIVDYVPDALGRPTQVGTYVTSLQYFPNGQVKQIRYANNVVTDIGQNERLFPTSFGSSSGVGLSVSNFLYGYDLSGNPDAFTDNVNTTNNKSFWYDGLNQLRTANGPWGSGSLTYDKRGNLKTKVLGSDSLTHNYNPTSNRLESISGSRPFSFQYDRYGNVISNGARAFQYDDSSNLTSASTSPETSFVYDGNNRRVLEQQSGVTARYSVYSRTGLRLFEQDGVSFETTDFVYLGSNLVATRAICYSLIDNDSDGIPTCYELRAGLNPQSASDASQDIDSDGLSNLGEYQAGTDYYKSDTDGDGISDGYEQQYGLGPLTYNPNADPDGDGLTNLQEFSLGSNPNDPDDPTPQQRGTLSFASATYSVSENGAAVTLTVSRTGGSFGAASIQYATSNGTASAGSDYTTSSGTLTWTGGNATNKTFSIPILNDTSVEGNETLTVALSGSSGAALGSPNTATVTITDHEPGTLQLSPASYSILEGSTSVSISVTRTNASNGVVGVNYSTSNGSAAAGSDYTAASGTLSWADGDSTTKTFSVTILDDSAGESAETINLALSSPTGGATLGPATGSITISDNEPGTLRLSASSYSVNEGGGYATVTVTRTNGSYGAASINYATNAGPAPAASPQEDYLERWGTFSWASGESASQVVNVAIGNDNMYEGNEYFTITLSGPSGATMGSPSSATVTIVDNDPVPSGTLRFGFATYSVAENGGSVTIGVQRESSFTGSLSVNYSTSNGTAAAGSDFTSTSGTLTWNHNDGTTATFSVPILNDTTFEGNEAFTVALSGGSYGVTLGSPSSTTVTITDDDSSAPGAPSSISVPSSSGPSYTISWGAASGTNPSYQLYEATNGSFSGEVLVYSGTGLSHAVSGKSAGTYYYRVRACNSSGCSAFRTGANGVTVTLPIQVLNPTIQVSYTGQLTTISTLANLNGNPATIHSFSPQSCPAGAQIQSGAQSVRWSNNNTYYHQCEMGWDVQCSASYVIRNSSNGQLHNGTAAVTVVAQPLNLPPGYQCP